MTSTMPTRSVFRLKWWFLGFLLLALLGGDIVGATSLKKMKKSKEVEIMDKSSHPGTIRMMNMYDKSVRIVLVKDVPVKKQFIYLKDGREIDDARDATEIIPVVEVRVFPLDDEGKLTTKDKASLIRIREFGPDGQSLRQTTMTRN